MVSNLSRAMTVSSPLRVPEPETSNTDVVAAAAVSVCLIFSRKLVKLAKDCCGERA